MTHDSWHCRADWLNIWPQWNLLCHPTLHSNCHSRLVFLFFLLSSARSGISCVWSNCSVCPPSSRGGQCWYEPQWQSRTSHTALVPVVSTRHDSLLNQEGLNNNKWAKMQLRSFLHISHLDTGMNLKFWNQTCELQMWNVSFMFTVSFSGTFFWAA